MIPPACISAVPYPYSPLSERLAFDFSSGGSDHFGSNSRSATNMHELVTEGNIEAMREAVAGDPESVNQLNESGLPPLYIAALFRNRRAINFLLDMEQ